MFTVMNGVVFKDFVHYELKRKCRFIFLNEMFVIYFFVYPILDARKANEYTY